MFTIKFSFLDNHHLKIVVLFSNHESNPGGVLGKIQILSRNVKVPFLIN